MSGDTPPPTVIDATALSNFASTDGVGLVAAVLPRPVTVPAVRRELERGHEEGYQFLEAALDAIDDEIPVVDRASPVPGEFSSALDPGEASVLHLAR